MKLTQETKLFVGIFAVTAIIIAIAMVIMTKPAKPLTKDELILPTTQTKGQQDAPVWLVEFSDFECPACKAFSSTIADLLATYPDKLLVAYRYFPLDFHPQAMSAAQAAEAAGKQGKFWEMEQLLFANQASLSAALYPQLAAQLGLSLEQFSKDMQDPSVKQLIQNDATYGVTIGIEGTPTFYLNGKKLFVNAPLDLRQEVEHALSQ